MRNVLLLSATLLCVLGCESGAAIGTSCTRNGECGSPLVCRFGRCRTECVAQRDCPLGTTCLLDADGNGSCALRDDPDCSSGAACAEPLACVGRECVNVCMLGPECPSGSACVPIGDGRARCVRTDGVDAGLAPDDAATEDAGADAGAQCHSPDCSGLQQVVVGDGFSCVLTTAGAVWCWGVATAIARGGDVAACIPRSGSEHACATPLPLLVGGAAVPAPAIGVDAIDAQDTGGCFLVGGDVFCWGTSEVEAPLGRAGSNDYLAGRVQLAAGGTLVGQARVLLLSQSALSVDASDQWSGWGSNLSGEVLGAGVPQTLATPITMISARSSDVVATGTHHACAVTGGAVECWGANERGQADPSAPAVMPIAPTPVAGLPPAASALSLGRAHSCALVGSDLYCWGAREEILWGDDLDAGAVGGDGGIAANDLPPTLVVTASPGWRALVPMRNAGDICAIDVSDHLWCWGQGYAGASTPSMVAGLPPVRSAAVAWTHGCAITMDERLFCWGLDDTGERGQGTIVPSGAQPPAEVIW